MAQLLLSNGCNPESRDKEGKSAYYLAKLFKNDDVSSVLCSAEGADVCCCFCSVDGDITTR